MHTLKSLLFVALLLFTVGFGLTGCKSSDPAGDDNAAAAAECACPDGKEGKDVWCEKCEKGFVGGEAVKCKGCHTAKTGGAACESCAGKADDKG